MAILTRHTLLGLTQQQEPAVNLELTVQIAPRGVLYSNQGLVELGAYEINKLRRPTRVAFYEWTPVSGTPQPQDKPKGPRYDRMKLAHEYQLLHDSGELGSQADLARYLGVSRARVTQVLNRLKNNRTRSTVALDSRWPAIASMAATIMLLMCGIGYLWIRSQIPPIAQSVDTPHVAVITQAVGAYDIDGVAIRSGQHVKPSQLSIDRGLVRLDFVNGATVAVEGPAKIEVVDETRVVLLGGVITATIPESAIGFVVDTGTARVVDLGTAFGVSVGDDGTTDVCVFEGEVTVRRKGSAAGQPALVREGEAGESIRSSIAGLATRIVAWRTTLTRPPRRPQRS